MPQNSPLELATTALSIFGLPTLVKAEFVSGGLLHRLLRVETNSQSYALKLLSPSATKNAESRAKFERAESVASLALETGIPALCGIKGSDDLFLQKIGEQWVILYLWQEGLTLPPTAASPDKCRLMGENLAKLHSLEIRFPDQQEPVPEAFETGHFRQISQRATEQKTNWAMRLNEVIDVLEEINTRAMQSQLLLQEKWVTGHLDCDQKNVLWQGDEPTILDWESAKPIHPALEAMGAGLSWAGQSAGETNYDSFAAFFDSYLNVNPLQLEDLECAVEAVLGKWIIWLEFNLQRLLDENIQGTPEAQIAFDAGMHALDTTLKLAEDGSVYNEWVKNIGERRKSS